MFTPNRKRSGAVQSRRSNVSLRTIYRDSSRSSLLRRSLAPRSPSLSNTSLLASPSVTTLFGSSSHTVKSHESSIPVLVTEAITMTDDLQDTAVLFNSNGWACLLAKQKMYIWCLQQSGSFKTPICKELSLPPTDEDEIYIPNLICLTCNERAGGSVSILAISSKGRLSYWNNIITSNVTTSETQIEFSMSKEDCFCIVSVQPNGYILTSSHGTLYHIDCSQNGITSTQLHAASGMLAGIGRRVSSFFFSSSSQAADVIQVVSRQSGSKSTCQLYMLTSNSMQLWTIKLGYNSESVSAQLVHEADLHQCLADKVSAAVWGEAQSNVQLWPLDVRYGSRAGHAVILVAVLDPADLNKRLHYAACILADVQNTNEVDVVVFEFTQTYQKEEEQSLLSFELVVEDPSCRSVQHLAMWSRERMVLRNLLVTEPGKFEDSFSFSSSSGDRLLGAGQCDGAYVFFSAANGILTCTTTLRSNLPASMEDSILNSPATSMLQSPDSSRVLSIPGTPLMTQAKMEQLETSANSAQRLQAAFLHYCRHNLKQAQDLVMDAFPADKRNSTLDSAVVVVSGDLLDDYPASDPRWAESVPHDVSSEYGGSAGSLILLHQLEDKQNAHAMFLKFLSEVGVWKSLSCYSSGRDKIVTRWLLCEHAEKLCAAISLIQKHPSHQGIVDAAIRRVLESRGKVANIGGLTPKDFFYREVSRIQNIFEYLIEEEEKSLNSSSMSPRERVSVVAGVNAVFEAMLSSARNYRKSKALAYEEVEENKEFQPWTIGAGRMNIRNIVALQHKLTIERGIPEAEDSQQRTVLHQSLTSLTDLVLSGYQEQLNSLSRDDASPRWAEVNSAYERHRSQLIGPLLTLGLREKATTLAEKYFDFSTLMVICDEAQDKKKLHEYMNTFESQGFSEFMFKWYMERGEHRKLLACCEDSPSGQAALTNYLLAHPKLAWMHQLRTDDYVGAHNTLRYLASYERESAANKKCFLSLGKLAAAFSDEPEDVIKESMKAINYEHTLLQYQETLPSIVVEKLGATGDDMAVLDPSRLIELYVSDENIHSNEVDFKKAFELIPYIQAEESDTDPEMAAEDADKWKLYVWCKAILRDSWKDVDPDSNPFEACSHTVLFKLLKLAWSSNILVDILPDADQLLQREELAELCCDSSFKYLLRASFEQVQRMQLVPTA